MTINTIANIVGIIAGLLTIIKIIKEFNKPISSLKVEQNNLNGGNYYTNNTTNIIKTTNTIVNTHTSKNSNDNDFENGIVIIIFTIVMSVISLAFYSQTYKVIPVICLLVLTFIIYRDTKIPFENTLVKNQWIFQKTTILIMIIILFFVPKSILNIINQIPTIEYRTLPVFLEWLTNIFYIIKELYQESLLTLMSLFGRIIASFVLLLFLFKRSTYKNNHKALKRRDIVDFSIFILILIFILNLEHIWNLIEPLRNSIGNWFNPPQ